MKKYLYAITAAAVMLAAFISCGQEKADSSSHISDNDEAVFTSEAATDAATEEAAEAETTTEAVTEEITEAPTEAVTEAAAEAPTEEPTEAVEVSDYKTAYLELINTVEDSDTLTYDLIYLDDDDIPELVTGHNGFYVNLYTYADGKVHTLMDRWSYGAMGNAGYEYVPKMNSVRNYNSDYAGLVGFTAYCSITAEHTLEATTVIETRLYEDTNGDGIPQDEEYIPDYQVYFIDGEEISYDEAVSYDAGKYEFIGGELTLDEIKAELS